MIEDVKYIAFDADDTLWENENHFAIHIPFHITWQHEHHTESISHPNYLPLNCIKDVLKCL